MRAHRVTEHPEGLGDGLHRTAHAKAGRRGEAEALFRKAIQSAKEITIRDNVRGRPANFNPSGAQCLRTIALGQAEAGFITDAIQTADVISDSRSRDGALATIAMAMANRVSSRQPCN